MACNSFDHAPVAIFRCTSNRCVVPRSRSEIIFRGLGIIVLLPVWYLTRSLLPQRPSGNGSGALKIVRSLGCVWTQEIFQVDFTVAITHL